MQTAHSGQGVITLDLKESATDTELFPNTRFCQIYWKEGSAGILEAVKTQQGLQKVHVY